MTSALVAVALGLVACNTGGGRGSGKAFFGPGSTGATSSTSTTAGTGSFSTVAAMASGARGAHTATLLGDGRVLVVGGISSGARGTLATGKEYHTESEVFDPATNQWALVSALNGATPNAGRMLDPTGTFATGRAWHSATVIDPTRVLIGGGLGFDRLQGNLPIKEALKSAFLFDSATNRFTRVPDMPVTRYMHHAVALPNSRALLAGGFELHAPGNNQLQPSATSADVFDGATSTWSSIGGAPGAAAQSNAHAYGAMVAAGQSDPIVVHGVALDNRSSVQNPVFLVVQGLVVGVVEPTTPGSTGGYPPTACEVFRTATSAFATGPIPVRNPSPSGLMLQGSVALSTGDAFFVGGEDIMAPRPPNTIITLNTSERFRPTANQFVAGPALQTARTEALCAEIGLSGDFLVVSGLDTNIAVIADAELYSGQFDAFVAKVPMAEGRHGHAVVSLRDGRVLVTGGLDNLDQPLATCEVFRR